MGGKGSGKASDSRRFCFAYNDGTYGAGSYNCELAWDLSSSSPVDPMDSACTDCEFMFDVTYTYDTSVSSDDGTCAYYGLTGDTSGTYGYSTDFDGYGDSWVFEYYGSYYWWGEGAFDSKKGTFQYWYGYEDYYYGSAYYTYYQYGDVLVK